MGGEGFRAPDFARSGSARARRSALLQRTRPLVRAAGMLLEKRGGWSLSLTGGVGWTHCLRGYPNVLTFELLAM